MPSLGDTETTRAVGTGTHLQTVAAVRLAVDNVKDVFVDFFTLRRFFK